MLKFSPANTKIKALREVADLKPYLGKIGRKSRKVYSFDLLSGHTCPFAKDCFAKVEIVDGKRKLIHGEHQEFTCFSASQEATFTPVYNLRKANTDAIQACKTKSAMVKLLKLYLPFDAGIIRIHVAGDFFNSLYFNAWLKVAKDNPNTLFYAYTKSLPFWQLQIKNIPANMVLTASKGGWKDDLINKLKLRSTVVVYDEPTAVKLGLNIDHTDEHAANPLTKDDDFALLIHGMQKKGNKASAAIKKLKKAKVKYSYGRKK
jgi:hypothetical protein